MNKTYTLKELADIGAKAAQEELPATCFEMIVGLKVTYPEHSKAREAFTKAILDAIGYEFPKDPEREAFEKWLEANPSQSSNGDLFLAWKAGREELRKELSSDNCQPAEEKLIPKMQYRRGKLEAVSLETEPAWIPWSGGECPLSDKVKKWEYKMRNGKCYIAGMGGPKCYRWNHFESDHDIIAYRVWE